MKRKVKFGIIPITFLILSSLSCTSVYESVYPTLVDGKYDSEFPYKSSSKQLEDISNSIKLINSIAFYRSYIFDSSTKYKVTDLNKLDFEVTAIEKVFFNNSASGTATLIHQNQGYVALITVAHIVSFPDTLYTYFFNPDGSSSQYVQSISIKTNQSNYIPDLPQGGRLEIILMDKNIDIAILGGKFLSSETQRLTIFNYPWGNSSELEWGSFVYIFGFPMNYKMISKGIVSNPGRDKSTFLIDAVFSRGFSGGTVLAVRDGVPNFELVGFVKSVPADFQYTLRPLTKKNELDFNPLIPYKGDIYVDKEQVLRAGITKVIGIETVKDFILDHKQELINKGYYFDNLFGAKDKTTLKIIH